MEDTLRTLYNMEIKMVYVLEARRKSVFLGKPVQQKGAVYWKRLLSIKGF